MQSKATTVASYLAELPPDRKTALQAVLKVIRANIDPAFQEGMKMTFHASSARTTSPLTSVSR